MGARRHSHGQAAVEFLALVPAVALLALVIIQVMFLAGAWLSAAGAARAGVRAAQVGAPVDEAARSALPGALSSEATITRDDEAVTVVVSAPGVVPGFGAFRVEAGARR